MTKFINLWSRGNDVFLHTKEGIMTIQNYPFYFCVRKEDATKHRDFLKDLRDAKRITDWADDGNGWIRLYVPYLNRELVIRAVRSMMKTYEDDLQLWKRYLVDEDIELDLDQRILYWDIETDDLKKGLEPGNEQIVSIAAINNVNQEFYYSNVKNEKKLLNWFIDLTKQHHLLVGWYSEGFDLVAITRRCELHKIPFDCKISEWSAKDMGGLDSVRKTGKLRARPETFNHIDLMMKIKELHYRDTELIKKVRSFGLDAVSSVILGEHKVHLDGETIYNLARNKPEKLKEYNLQDVRLLKKLDDKLQVTKQKLIEHWICGARINDYTSHGKIDPFALRAAKKMGARLPSKPSKEEIITAYEQINEMASDVDLGNKSLKKKGDYAGGYVFEPEKGLHYKVHAFDFVSLYPSIIKTFNVSIDSYLGTDKERVTPPVNYIVMPTGATFLKKERGVIPKIIQNLLDSRDQIRNVEMKKVKKNSEEYMNLHYHQYAFKVLANSMYGIMGANFSRYYKRELAEGITLTGQHLLKTSWKWMEDHEHHPIYGDTDSIFVKLKKKIKPEDIAEEIDQFLQKHLKKEFNACEGHLHLNHEATYERFILVAKKKYIGITATGDIKMTGMEARKRDTLPKAEEWQRLLIDKLLKEDRSEKYYFKWAASLVEHVFDGHLKKEELTFQKRLSKEIEEYGGLNKNQRKLPVPRHVKVAARIKEQHGESIDKLNLFSAGSYIPYIILDADDKENGCIYASDFKGTYDAEYYWHACFDPSKRVLEAVFPTVDWDVIAEDKLKTINDEKRKKRRQNREQEKEAQSRQQKLI